MNFNKNYTKKIPFILILSILLINLSFFSFSKIVNAGSIIGGTANSTGIEVDPTTLQFYSIGGSALTTIAHNTTVSAGENVKSGVWQTVGKYTLEKALAAAAKQAALKLVEQLTNSIVDWINSGYQGQPAFVADPGQFLGDIADQTIGDMIFNNPDLNFLCAPFQLQVKIALGLSLGHQPLKKSISCTVTGIENNIDNASISGSINGQNINNINNADDVWALWLKSTQNPQNDPIGAYIIAAADINSQITANQNAKTIELAWGQGALTFNKCTETTYDKNNKVIGTKTITGSASNEKIPTGQSDGSYTKIGNCVTKTPGAIVTDMLGFKANSTGQITQMQAAMANGIDSIIGALLNSLVKATLEKIKGGILDSTPTQTSQDYSNLLNNAQTQIQNDYNTQTQSIFDGTITDPSQLLGPGYNIPTDQTLTTDNTGYYIDPSSPLYRPRLNATIRINSLLDSETVYQNNLKTTAAILIAGRDAFAKARTCNAGYNNPTLFLRATEIQANVVTNIDGMGYQGNAPIEWNLDKIKNLLAISDANIKLLNDADTALISASTITNITDAMTPINSQAFNTDPKSTSITYVKTWLTGSKNQYSASPCLIDISSALNISTSTIASSTVSAN